jgi:hypothetical protein
MIFSPAPKRPDDQRSTPRRSDIFLSPTSQRPSPSVLIDILVVIGEWRVMNYEEDIRRVKWKISDIFERGGFSGSMVSWGCE